MESMTATKKVDESKYLPNKVYTLLPVPRKNGIITDPDHKAFFMFPETKVRFCLPFDVSKGSLVDIFESEEERAFFEGKVGQSLNVYERDKAKNYWMKFEVVITKTDHFMENGITFHLNNVMDNLKYRVLCANESVCKNWEDRYESGEYRFAFREEGYTEEQQTKRADLNIAAYKHFAKIQDSRDKMYDFLSVYWMKNSKLKRPSSDAGKDAMISMIQNIIDTDINGFLEVASDTNYDLRIMVFRALMAGFIQKESTTRDYQLTESHRYIGRSTDDVVVNLLTPEFQEDRMMLEALLDKGKGKTK